MSNDPGGNPMHAFRKRYRYDSALFVREVLGVDPDEWQVEVLRAYDRGERLISVLSCHGPGKTAVLAWLLTHQILFFNPQKAVATAPTSSQLFDALAAETKSWIARLPLPLRSLLEVKSDRIELIADPDGSFISFRTSRADSPEAMQGVHSDKVLLIGDEASGIPEAVFAAAAGSMSGETATTILAGNPTRTSGTFFESHHRNADRWVRFAVSADVPEAPAGHYRSARVSQAFVEEIAHDHGRDSNEFRVRVLGLFPRTDTNAVIPYEHAAGALQREITVRPNEPVIWGVDVARQGTDRSALAVRKGRKQVGTVEWRRDSDLMQIAGWIKNKYDASHGEDRPVEINVDSIGLGAGVLDRLRELGLPARGINVAEAAAMSDRYARLRDELWWKAREWFASLDCQLADSALVGELTSVYYGYTSSGKIKVESKDEMRKRDRRSPDLADAFVLTFASNAVSAMHGSAGNAGWGKPVKRNLKGIV